MFATKVLACASLAIVGLCNVQPASLSTATPSTTTNSTATIPTPELVAFGDGVVGALHRPAPGSAHAPTVIFLMHAEQDYLNFVACTELPKRGYSILCANNELSKTGTETDLDFELMMSNVNEGVTYLRNQTEFKTIVLLGHSGGGAMLSSYQNIAENGLSACNGPEKIKPCSSSIPTLEKADGVIFIDANFGIPSMTVMSLNPAIEDETTGYKINSTLDLFNTANGFTSSGANYTASFKKVFQSGVAARMQRLVAHALERDALIDAGNGSFADDEPMYIPDASYIGFNNKFFCQDPRWLHHTTHAWPLVHNNGTNTTMIVPSVRPADCLNSGATSFANGALKTTVKKFLETFAVRVNGNFTYKVDGVTGIDWDSGNMIPISAAKGITVPLLAMGNTGHYEYLNAEKTYLAAASKDKSIAFIEGASHTIVPCTACETYPGEYSNTVKNAFDTMAKWLSVDGRF